MMKVGVFLAFVVSSSAVILKMDPQQAEYPGKVPEPLTEETVNKLCVAMEEHSTDADHTGEHFFSVTLPQIGGPAVVWWRRGTRRVAIRQHTYQSGCYRWEMRPCYGYYPNTFNDPCTFWIPKILPGGKCLYDSVARDTTLAQKPVSMSGRSAAQLCETATQAIGKKFFSMLFIPMKMNLKSDHRCETWKYTPGADEDDDGKWDTEKMADGECDTKYPEFNIEELEDPNKYHPICLPSLNGEYECFFNDDNMPMEKQIEIQDKPNTMMTSP